MRTLHYFSALLACALLTGCGGMAATKQGGGVPASTESARVAGDGMRAGDKVTMRLDGVPDGGWVTEVQIPASGEVTVPLLTESFQAIGHSTSDLASEITAAYKSQKIYTNPVVTIIPEERYLSVGGEVRSPTRVIYAPDMTLMSAINSCGGFTEYADRRAVRIIRGQQVIVVDCRRAIRVAGADPLVYPDDQINVPRTIF